MGSSPEPTSIHPLLTRGDVQTGQVFVAILCDVVKNPLHRNARGFTSIVLAKIGDGVRPVDAGSIRQLLLDYYAAYPKRVAAAVSEYVLLRSVIDGTWKVNSLPKATQVTFVSSQAVTAHELNRSTADQRGVQVGATSASKARTEVQKATIIKKLIEEAQPSQMNDSSKPLPRIVNKDLETQGAKKQLPETPVVQVVEVVRNPPVPRIKKEKAEKKKRNQL